MSAPDGPAPAPVSLRVTKATKARTGNAVRANVWVEIAGVVDVQCKVIEGPKGLFVVPPAAEYRMPNGRLGFTKKVLFTPHVKRDLAQLTAEQLDARRRTWAAVQAMVLAAYQAMLDGGQRPPRKREQRADVVKRIMDEAARFVDREAAGRFLAGQVELLLDDDTLDGRDQVRVARLAMEILRRP